MRIKIQQFLFGKNHSWSVVGKSLGKELISRGHDVEMISSDGVKPEFLEDIFKPYLKERAAGTYDMQLSYTAMPNFADFMAHGKKNRFGIWAWEFDGKNVIPEGFAKYYKFVDKFLPPSNYCLNIFNKSKIPESSLALLPHGYNPTELTDNKYKVDTNKKYIIGSVIGQVHRRKNLAGLFDAYGRAFNKSDDVCLAIKVSIKKKLEHIFEQNFWEIYNEFNRQYKNHAEVKIITDYIPNIYEFHNACDVIFTMANCEGFWIPGLDALACGQLVIAPRHGGQLDFLNDSNSLLIDGKIVRVPRNYFYWTPSMYAEMFEPNIDNAASLLKKAYENHDELVSKFKPNMNADQYTWEKVADRLLGLCE